MIILVLELSSSRSYNENDKNSVLKQEKSLYIVISKNFFGLRMLNVNMQTPKLIKKYNNNNVYAST